MTKDKMYSVKTYILKERYEYRVYNNAPKLVGLHTIETRWWISVWSDCICTGSTSVMFRSVLCMRATDESGTRAEVVKESECAAHKKPATQKACNATEEENECAKRSVVQDTNLKPHRYFRRAVNPKTAFVAVSSSDTSNMAPQEPEISPNTGESNKDEEENYSESKIQKKSSKPQNSRNVNNKQIVNKGKAKSSEKESLQIERKKIVPSKCKEEENLKSVDILKNNADENSKYHIKSEELSLGSDRGKQVAKLNSKYNAPVARQSNYINKSDKAKQSDDSDVDVNSQDTSITDDKCENTTTESSTCQTVEIDTTEASTCKATNAVQPHRRTTCCKTTVHRKMNTKPAETTTMRPVVVKMDELNMHNFALTVVPLDFPGKKKLPQTDPEFINLGNIGQFGVGSETNGSIISGQEAIDFLEFARSNASEEPVILHEDVHN